MTTMGKKLKLGIIGTGNIFQKHHAPAWASHPEIELVAVYDAVQEKSEALAKQYQIPRIYSNYQDLIAQDDIDLVDICTPNRYHSEIAIAALKAGKHVFCEKPDAVNHHEAQKMADTAEQSGKICMVMRNNRFSPSVKFMKRYVDEGLMGDIYTGRCGWIRRRGTPGRGGWFTTKELSGGGPLIDLGVHFIDVAMWLMGNPKPVSVVGATYRKFADNPLSDSDHSIFGESNVEGIFDVEDLASGYIRFDNGATLQIEFSWASNIDVEKNFVELRGTKSGVCLENGELKIFSEVAGTLCDLIPRLPRSETSNHAANIYHFIDVVQNRAEPIFKPEQGVNMIKILCAIYESARIGAEVKL